MQHWRRPATDGAKFWISSKQPAFLSSFSPLQVIQNKRPWCSAVAYVIAGWYWTMIWHWNKGPFLIGNIKRFDASVINWWKGFGFQWLCLQKSLQLQKKKKDHSAATQLNSWAQAAQLWSSMNVKVIYATRWSLKTSRERPRSKKLLAISVFL